MVNMSVFRGSDGVIEFALGDGTPEEAKAKEISEAYSLSPVGRVTNVEIKVESDLKAFHELGQRYPTDLRPGNVNISGTIGRAYINGALLKLLLGDAATSRPQGTFLSPSFDIVLKLENPGLSSENSIESTVTVHGVKFENWNYKIPEDDFVMESISFKALWISVEDQPSAG